MRHHAAAGLTSSHLILQRVYETLETSVEILSNENVPAGISSKIISAIIETMKNIIGQNIPEVIFCSGPVHSSSAESWIASRSLMLISKRRFRKLCCFRKCSEQNKLMWIIHVKQELENDRLRHGAWHPSIRFRFVVSTRAFVASDVLCCFTHSLEPELQPNVVFYTCSSKTVPVAITNSKLHRTVPQNGSKTVDLSSLRRIFLLLARKSCSSLPD